ncbi:MAG: phenylalanine--tRNA ligase subunit alpha [bacterium]|nr:phenylalanine--tRNA ligase subunit alpha [bacterium]
MSIIEEIEKIKSFALEEISKAQEINGLENLRVKYLGRNGDLTHILRSLEKYPLSDRKNIGKLANEIRLILEKQMNEKKKYLENLKYGKILESEKLDVTASVNKISAGHLHPITQTLKKAEKIFSFLGFEIVEGPEIETEFYNFDALNIPASHPARDMWDTFWLRGNHEIPNPKSQIPNKSERLLMRTHTSPMQVRYMQKNKPPFRIIVPGRVFRHEATDARHASTFFQLEGLMVGEDINIANIKSVFETFFSNFFEADVKIRLRPSYFPFVEPGLEGDVSCMICQGKGCRLCKGTGWLEIFGAGMVNQKVFTAAGYPKNKYQGFAFGFGLDRFPMMLHGIDDIRLFHSGDLRFLKQF